MNMLAGIAKNRDVKLRSICSFNAVEAKLHEACLFRVELFREI